VFDSAEVEYAKVEASFPKGDKVPAALYKQALSQERLKKTSAAKKTLEDLVKRYPTRERRNSLVSVWAARSAASAAGLVATTALVAIGPTAAHAQATADSLDGLPIRHIEIIARNIYDPLPGGPLRPFYRLADAIHVRTRPSTIRNAMFLNPGEPWTDQRGKENERALRALGVLEPIRVEARRAGGRATQWTSWSRPATTGPRSPSSPFKAPKATCSSPSR
jgi:hypothetical protein